MSFGDTAWNEEQNGYSGFRTLPESPGMRLQTETGWGQSLAKFGAGLTNVGGWLDEHLPSGMPVADPSVVPAGTHVPTIGEALASDPLRSSEEANAQSIPGWGKRYNKPVRQSQLDADNEMAAQQRWDAEVMGRTDSLGLLDLGAQLGGAVTDPTNVLLAMSGLGEGLGALAFGERAVAGAAAGMDAASAVGRYAKLWNGVSVGVGRSFLAGVPFAAKDLAVDYASGRPDDFDAGNELATIAGFAVLHGAFHLAANRLGMLGAERVPLEPTEAARGEAAATTPAGAPAPAGEAPRGAGRPTGRPVETPDVIYQGQAEAAGAPLAASAEPPTLRGVLEEMRARAAGAGYDVEGAARAADPEAVDAFRGHQAEAGRWRNIIRQLGEARAGSPEAVAARAEISSILDRVGGVESRLTKAAADRLASARARLEAATTQDTPQMAQAREALQQEDYGARGMAERVSAAYRQARQNAPVDWRSNPLPTPSAIDKPAVVKQLTPTEATASFASAVDSVRQGEDVRVGQMITNALDPAAPGAAVRAALAAGETPGEGITPQEQALWDAQQLRSEDLRSAAAGESAARGELLARLAPQHGGLVDAEGRPTELGEARLESAVLAKAFPDRELVDALMDKTDGVLRGLGKALRAVAPDWAQLNASVEEGRTAGAYKATDALVWAANLVKAARETGTRIGELVTSHVDEEGAMFTGNNAIDQTTEAFLRFFYQDEDFRRPTAAGKVAAVLADYARLAMQEEAPDGQAAAADAAVNRLRVTVQKDLLGWDLRAGIERAPGRAEGAGGEAGAVGRGGVEHGLAGGEPADRGLPAEGGAGAGAGGEPAPGAGGAAGVERAAEPGPGGAGAALPGEPRGEPAAGGEGTQGGVDPSARLIAEDEDLKAMAEQLRRAEQQLGKPIEYEPGRDPSTWAKALRAAEVCMLGEL
jgi:hypothetical protein